MQKLIKMAKDLESDYIYSGCDLENFPKLAADCLKKISPEDVTLGKIKTYLDNTGLEKQLLEDDTFGEPSITLFFGEQIVMDVLIWTSSDTNIHSHGFTGAFKVMRGDTIQALYKLENEIKPPYPSVLDNKINLAGLKNIKKGDIQQIPSGIAFIHKSLHLETPTINLIIRTLGYKEESIGKIQHSFKLPDFMFRRSHSSPSLSKKISFCNAIIKSKLNDGENIFYNELRGIPDYILIGLSIVGPGAIKFTKESHRYFQDAVNSLMSERGIDIKMNNPIGNSLISLNNFELKSHNKLKRMIEAMIDCRVNISDMINYLRLWGIQIDYEEVKVKIISLIKKYNDENLLNIKLNEVAFLIFEQALLGNKVEKIVDIIFNAYDADKEQIRVDTYRMYKQIKQDPYLSFLFS